MIAPRSALLWAQYFGTSIVGGSGYLMMTIALQAATPTQIAWARSLLGAAALFLFVAIAHREHLAFPRVLREWIHPVVLGMVFMFLPFQALAWSQQYMQSNIAAVLNALTPITTLLWVVLCFRADRLRPLQLLGLGIGTAGVTIMAAPWTSDGGVHLGALFACLLAVTCFGFGMAYMRAKVQSQHWPGLSLVLASSLVAAAANVIGTPWLALTPVQFSPAPLTAILILGIVCTGLASAWSYNVISAWGATVASTSLYLSPVVGVVLGYLVLGELLAPHEAIGALLAVSALFLVQPGRSTAPLVA